VREAGDGNKRVRSLASGEPMRIVLGDLISSTGEGNDKVSRASSPTMRRGLRWTAP
jgi:hypothetical protein